MGFGRSDGWITKHQKHLTVRLMSLSRNFSSAKYGCRTPPFSIHPPQHPTVVTRHLQQRSGGGGVVSHDRHWMKRRLGATHLVMIAHANGSSAEQPRMQPCGIIGGDLLPHEAGRVGEAVGARLTSLDGGKGGRNGCYIVG